MKANELMIGDWMNKMESEIMKLIYMTAAVVVLFALAIFQGVTLVKMKQYNDDSQRFIEYWRNKTDSLQDENFKLYMQIYELKDSIVTLRFER